MRDRRPHSSLDELAEHHLDRGQVYAVLAALLDTRCVEDGVSAARAVLRRGNRLAPRIAVLADVLVRPGHERDVAVPRFTEHCGDPDAPSRLAAHGAASLVASPAKIDEVRALSMLAWDTGRALRRGDIAVAAQLNDLQDDFLHTHACECLRQLSDELRRSAAIVYVAAGNSLVAQLDVDLGVA
jgi:hypothetical protein